MTDSKDDAMSAAAFSIMAHLNMVAEQKPKVRITEAQRKKKIAQAKDIPQQALYDLIKGLRGVPKPYRSYPGLTWYDNKTRWVMRDELCAAWPEIPPKVIIAKARNMIAKGIIDGCPCGCRGDFEIIEPCKISTNSQP